jgi:hypothetical protein
LSRDDGRRPAAQSQPDLRPAGRARSTRRLPLPGLLTLLAGLALMAYAAFLLVEHALLLAAGLRAQGAVVAVEDGSEESTGVYVRFTAQDGNSYSFVDYLKSGNTGNAPGQTFPVLYFAGAPEGAVIDSFMRLWIAPLGLGLAGACVVYVSGLAGACAFLRPRLRRRRGGQL